MNPETKPLTLNLKVSMKLEKVEMRDGKPVVVETIEREYVKPVEIENGNHDSRT